MRLNEIAHELTVKPESGSPRRYRIARADDASAEWWLVEDEWTGCTWRPQGREPLCEAEWGNETDLVGDG